MDLHRKERIVNRTFKFIGLTVLIIVAYQLYSYYRVENLADYKMQNSHNDPAPPAVIKPYTIRDSVAHEIDSIKRQPIGDSIKTSEVTIMASAIKNDSIGQPSVIQPVNRLQEDVSKNTNRLYALQGPSALFSRVFTITLGKTVPVNVLWSDSGTSATNFRLITIKADDIADNKARFTIEDPFHVLLFSQTGYAAHDKIIIADESHNLNISVLQVNANSVVVNVASPLNENIVKRLQRLE